MQTEFYDDEPILFRVNIQNKADSALTLVYALEGSDVPWRAPEAYFVARQLTPARLPAPSYRCAQVAGIDSTDFITLLPGASFDPLYKQAQSTVQLPTLYPLLPAGTYEITFQYSTMPTQPLEWTGGSHEPLDVPATEARLRRVPRASLESNAVRVRVQPARARLKQLGAK
ncbi:hypothetical protein [Hymenobacter lucidus]|uniref:hypothetical protein n=1 Tax=Hymenobacter lucidus TaxID=2880930 RepID=UPI001CF3DBA9|nr:hypothetical protein [Hymenobacter lucidus]